MVRWPNDYCANRKRPNDQHPQKSWAWQHTPVSPVVVSARRVGGRRGKVMAEKQADSGDSQLPSLAKLLCSGSLSTYSCTDSLCAHTQINDFFNNNKESFQVWGYD